MFIIKPAICLANYHELIEPTDKQLFTVPIPIVKLKEIFGGIDLDAEPDDFLANSGGALVRVYTSGDIQVSIAWLKDRVQNLHIMIIEHSLRLKFYDFCTDVLSQPPKFDQSPPWAKPEYFTALTKFKSKSTAGSFFVLVAQMNVNDLYGWLRSLGKDVHISLDRIMCRLLVSYFVEWRDYDDKINVGNHQWSNIIDAVKMEVHIYNEDIVYIDVTDSLVHSQKLLVTGGLARELIRLMQGEFKSYMNFYRRSLDQMKRFGL